VKNHSLQGFAAVALLGLALFAVAAVRQPTPEQLDGVKVISAEEGKRMLDRGVAVIDTRTAAEYEDKTITGARSVPYRERSPRNVRFDRARDRFDLGQLPADKNAPVVFFCSAPECWKSYKASVLAKDAGYTQVHWMRGGLPEWTEKGLPTQAGVQEEGSATAAARQPVSSAARP
jgi:rhodanese-related sulfurtransferase